MSTEDLHATDSKEPSSDVESENSDDLEMPVLKAEIPWPPSLAAKSAAKADNVAAKSAAKADNVAAKSSAKNDAAKSGGSCGATSHPPEMANKVKSCDHVASSIRPLDDRDEQQPENSLLSGGTVSALCDKNYESNEKPKTSEKCYYNTSSTTPVPPVSDTSDSEAVSSSRSLGNGKTTEQPSRQKPPSAALSDSDSDSDLELLCLKRKKVPTSQQIAEGSSEFKLEEENTEQVFDRLVHSSSKGNTAAATKTTASKTTTADKNATALTSSAVPVRHGEKGDKIVTSFGDESDQQVMRQRREKIQQQQHQSPVKNEVSGGGGSTSSIWGKQIASFDLSDDYVNDYLREQQAKKIETIPDDPTSSQVADLLGGASATSPPPSHRLLSSPPPSSSHQRQARKVASRAASFDIIPACVPDSIGTEIDDILHSGFITMGGGKYGNIHDSEASQDAVSLSSMTSSMSGSGPVLGGRSGRRASKRRSGKGASGPECSPAAARRSGGKKARQKSTDNLHPNLLPGSSGLFIFMQCCGSGSGSGRSRNFLQDPDPDPE